MEVRPWMRRGSYDRRASTGVSARSVGLVGLVGWWVWWVGGLVGWWVDGSVRVLSLVEGGQQRRKTRSVIDRDALRRHPPRPPKDATCTCVCARTCTPSTRVQQGGKREEGRGGQAVALPPSRPSPHHQAVTVAILACHRRLRDACSAEACREAPPPGQDLSCVRPAAGCRLRQSQRGRRAQHPAAASGCAGGPASQTGQAFDAEA